MSENDVFDLIVVGGGINGAGVARDAAGRGLKVLLCEKDDLGNWTSSASTKLIHGGLRYLEHYEFRLVKEALMEREVLINASPHIAWPLRFVLPHNSALRPAWMIRLGLFLYDWLGGPGQTLPKSCGVDLTRHEVGAPLQENFKKGFIYSDGWVQDARLVVLCAQDARDKGAEILPRTRCVKAERKSDQWEAVLEDQKTGEQRTVRARLLINAAGPWAKSFLSSSLGTDSAMDLRLVRGSHVVVPKLYDHDHAYIFQNPDKRIIFAIPYEDDFTLVGTTDEDHGSDPSAARISDEEVRYICESASRYFKKSVSTEDVVWTYAGVRPLFDNGETDASKTTRDYTVERDEKSGVAPALHIWGGKLTTYRKLAQAVLKEACDLLGVADKPWTRDAVLPGGDLPEGSAGAMERELLKQYPWLPQSLAYRFAKTYGAQAVDLLGDAASPEDMGMNFGADFYEREVRYLVDREWAQTVEDILWRRTKMGLRLEASEVETLKQWLDKNQGQAAA